MFWKAGSADWLPEGFGVKFYYCPLDRDYAWNRQKLAHENGFAPETGQRVDAISKNGFRMCGYMTEMAEKDRTKDHLLAVEHREGLERIYEQTFGSEARDIRGANIGRIDGRVVMIDFGPLTERRR
jgi:hypothetical protein